MDEQIRQLAQQLLDSGIGKLSVREAASNCAGYEPTYCLP
jgi:hypothetical protein